jgi:hypothetical protein
MTFWVGSYLTGRTKGVRVGDYLYETIYCHSGVPQGSHLGPLFFIAGASCWGWRFWVLGSGKITAV